MRRRSEGVQRETRRHAYLLRLIGIEQVCVVVNKMDAVDFDESAFESVQTAATEYLESIGVHVSHVVPTSARGGDNVVASPNNLAWYDGPSLLGALDSLRPSTSATDLPLRPPVQEVYRFDDRRIISGRIECSGESIGFTLDEDLFVERGDIASHETDQPIETDVFRGRIFWLGSQEMVEGGSYRVKIATLDVPVVI